MSQPSTEFLKLVDDVQDVLIDHDLDDVIPVLAGLLSEAFYMSGQDKKRCVSYFVGIMDYNFEKIREIEERKKQ